jgi:Ankyrin repeats (many copies)
LGVYKYGGFDNRLDWQMMQALHSFCGAQDSVQGPLASFSGHCASTLSGWYIDRLVAGVEVDDTNTTIGSLAWRYLSLSACSGSAAASEALYSIFYMLWPSDRTIPSGAYPLLAGRALRSGMEFILREVMDNDIPGKEQFLDFFATRLCRGTNLMVGSPDPDIPLMDEEMLFKRVEDSELTPEAIFRMAATWGQLSTLRVISSRFKLDINGQDGNGETALLRACRAGHYDIAFWLLKTMKADPTISTKLGITPLHWIHVFSADEALSLAKFLRKRGANPNAIAVKNGNCTVEAEYWFFKGPPLIRAVASGNEAAVCALLAIGADPLVPIQPNDENSVVFAARRLRAPILKLLLKEVPDYPVWEVDRTGHSLLAKVISCSVEYAAKIHGRRHEKARIETFDLLWNWKNRRRSFFRRSLAEEITGQRMLRSISRGGRIPLQQAVYECDMVIVKHLSKLTSEATDSGPLLVELMANIGLQAAVLYEKPAMVAYFLSAGAHPLQPQFCLEAGKEYQVPPSMFTDPTRSPDEKNTLHLCARAGSSAEVIGQHLVDNLKLNFYQSLSTQELNMRKQCAIELTYYLELPGGTDDPLLDKRDESDNTPFFLALQNEEYEFVLPSFAFINE